MTIETGTIIVIKVPECPEGGGMTYTHNGVSQSVSQGSEFDLSENGSF